jgi:hypothetical protein
MSALIAERRDWAEDPRQASLFDALAPPPERAQPGQDPESPREEARIVEFPKRPGMPAAPADADTVEPQRELAPQAPADAAAPDAAARADAALPGPPLAPRADAAAPAPLAAPLAEAGLLAPAPRDAAVLDTTPAVEGASAIEAELVVAPEDLAGDKTCTPRVAGSPLAGPTLDDVMSRVWEGLVTGLPAACPVCRGEVVPSVHGPLHGRCSSCGTSID